MARRFRKRPVVVEAVQWLPAAFEDGAAHTSDVVQWVLDNGGTARWHEAGLLGRLRPGDEYGQSLPEFIDIETLEGTMRAVQGDWIIRGVQGEFYPCKPDVFAATYEEVLP